jgi:hypothetical protein
MLGSLAHADSAQKPLRAGHGLLYRRCIDVDAGPVAWRQTELPADSGHRLHTVTHDPPQRRLHHGVLNTGGLGVVVADDGATPVTGGRGITEHGEQVHVPAGQTAFVDQIGGKAVPYFPRAFAELHRGRDGGFGWEWFPAIDAFSRSPANSLRWAGLRGDPTCQSSILLCTTRFSRKALFRESVGFGFPANLGF